MNPAAPSVAWNDEVRLILSDVDETVADLYLPAQPGMIDALRRILEEERSILFVTGSSIARVRARIVDLFPAALRSRVLVAHCNGAELWGFGANGDQLAAPFYSRYKEVLRADQKDAWRGVIRQLIEEFHLRVFPATPLDVFHTAAGDDPLAVMLEDRGPQITFEVVNGYRMDDGGDLREPMLARGRALLEAEGIPITPRFGGVFALDFSVEGVSKTNAVRYVFEHEDILRHIGRSPEEAATPRFLEIWGDKFDQFHGGTDRHMQEAVSPQVRAIDFRDEDPAGFLPGYNVVVWRGEQHLQDGLLEYLSMRA